MLVVTGITGQTGGQVAASLAAKGIPFRGLARDPAMAPDVGDNEVVKADMAKPETLPSALAGATAAYLVTPPSLDKVELQSNFARAAADAGVEHIVKLSVPWAGEFPEVNLCRMHGASEKAIIDAGIGLTALRPFGFMQNTFGDIPTIQGEGKLYNPLPPEARMALVDVRDIADCAAGALIDRAEGTFDLQGDAVTQPEIAATIGRHLGQKVEHVQVTPEQALQGMTAAGFPEWLAVDFGRFVERAVAEEPPPTDAIERLAGHRPRSFDEFVRDHLPVFKGPLVA